MNTKVSIVDQTINQLLAYISAEKLGPGDKMPTEKEVCAMVGAGRSTVREAYKVMQARGIVSSRQGKGVFLNDTQDHVLSNGNPFGDKEMQIGDYMDVRTAIETTAVRLAIKRATDSQIRELEQIQAELEQSVSDGDIWKMSELDENFHAAIAEMSNNPLMIHVNNIVAQYFKAFRLRSFGGIDNRFHVIPSHAMIIRAFQDRNCELGMLVMRQHLEQSYDDINAILAAENHLAT